MYLLIYSPDLLCGSVKKVVGHLLQLSPTPNPQFPMGSVPWITGVLCSVHPYSLDFQDGDFLRRLFKMP